MKLEESRVISTSRESTRDTETRDDHLCHKSSRHDDVGSPCFCIRHLCDSSYYTFVVTPVGPRIFLYPLSPTEKCSLRCSPVFVGRWQGGLRLTLGRVCTRYRGVTSDALRNNR